MPQLTDQTQEQLEQDAKRYRWLRDKSISFDQVGATTPYVVRGQTLDVIEGDALDAAVDNAMRK